MKIAPLRYTRPRTESELLQVLSDSGADAAVLAGGQSLIPQLALRERRPATLADINDLSLARAPVLHCGKVFISPLVRHRQMLESPTIVEHLPMLTVAARHLGNEAIRNRGTFCGSLVHGDPGAEFPACALALGAELHLKSAQGDRIVLARDFIVGPFCVARRPDEYLSGAYFPVLGRGDVQFFDEIARRPTGYALAGLATRFECDGSAISRADVVVFGVTEQPVLLDYLGSALRGVMLDRIDAREMREHLHRDLRDHVAAVPDLSYRLRLAETLLMRLADQAQRTGRGRDG